MAVYINMFSLSKNVKIGEAEWLKTALRPGLVRILEAKLATECAASR